MTASQRTRQWARLGARARLAEIEQERTAILREFPELAGDRGYRPKPRRRLSEAERKKLSEGMRRYWAERKKQSRD